MAIEYGDLLEFYNNAAVKGKVRVGGPIEEENKSTLYGLMSNLLNEIDRFFADIKQKFTLDIEAYNSISRTGNLRSQLRWKQDPGHCRFETTPSLTLFDVGDGTIIASIVVEQDTGSIGIPIRFSVPNAIALVGEPIMFPFNGDGMTPDDIDRVTDAYCNHWRGLLCRRLSERQHS